MEIQQLRHLLAVIQTGNFRQAAARLGISQPALSRSIKALEERLGVDLLERKPRGVFPTVYGQRVAVQGRIMLEAERRALDEVAGLRGLTQGSLSVGLTPNFVDFLVPEFSDRILAARPRLQLILHVELLEDLLKRLRVGELDLVFGIAASPGSPCPLGVVCRDICEIEIYIYVRSEHPLASHNDLKLEDVTKYEWATTRQLATDAQIDSLLNQFGVAPTQRIRSNSISMLRKVVLKRDLVAMLPKHIMDDDVACGRAKILDVPDMATRARAVLYYINADISSVSIAIETLDGLLSKK